MESMVPIMVLQIFVMVIVIGVFILFIRRRKNRHPDEQGKTPLFTGSFGGIIGMMRYSLPFLRLSVYDDMLVIGAWGTIVLPFSEIARIEMGRFRLSQGMRIHHTRKDVPERIIVWTGRGETIKSLLEGKVPFS